MASLTTHMTFKVTVRPTLWARVAIWYALLLINLGVAIDCDRAAAYIVRHFRVRVRRVTES